MLIDRKTQYCQGIGSLQLNLYIQRDLNQNPSKLFCGNWQSELKIYMERQKTQNMQHNHEGEE